jgi:hypothetical protein
MAPFRPQEGTPKGKTRWREVKVGILARLGRRRTRRGESVGRIYQLGGDVTRRPIWAILDGT